MRQNSGEQSLEQTKTRLRIKVSKTKHGRRKIALLDFLAVDLRTHRQNLLKRRVALGLGSWRMMRQSSGT